MRLPIFSWGLFCACSWTWCIGMYLPIVLLERYGWPGFIAFAVPNVVGCALFGYVVRTRERSERAMRTHGTAMCVFSAVTVAYHLYFAAWLVTDLRPGSTGEGMLPMLAAPLALCPAGLLISTLPDRWWPAAAAVVYVVSLTTLVTLVPAGLIGIPWTGADPKWDAVWLTPLLCFGFLLCPYLDATFHRALQRSGSRHAFGVVGVAFGVMIILTCACWGRPGLRLEPLILAHLASQAVFTVGAHLRELGRLGSTRRPAWLVAPLIILLAVPATRLAPDPAAAAADTYLRFLVFYGALFPAYVLVLMAAGRRPDRRTIIALLVVTAALSPFYELGMLHGRAWLLLPPVVVYGAWWQLSRGAASASR